MTEPRAFDLTRRPTLTTKNRTNQQPRPARRITLSSSAAAVGSRASQQTPRPPISVNASGGQGCPSTSTKPNRPASSPPRSRGVAPPPRTIHPLPSPPVASPLPHLATRYAPKTSRAPTPAPRLAAAPARGGAHPPVPVCNHAGAEVPTPRLIRSPRSTSASRRVGAIPPRFQVSSVSTLIPTRAPGFVAAWAGYLADLGVWDRFPAPIWASPPWPALDSVRRVPLCSMSGSPRPEFSGIARVHVAPAPDLRLRVRSQLCMA